MLQLSQCDKAEIILFAMVLTVISSPDDPIKARSSGLNNLITSCLSQDVQFEPERFCNTIVCDKPNNHLNKFKGYM